MRPQQEIYLCAYEDCDGHAFMNAWPYDEYREVCGWPEEPEKGVV